MSILCLLAVYIPAQAYMSNGLSRQIASANGYDSLLIEDLQNPQKAQPAKATKKDEPKLIKVIFAKTISKKKDSEIQILRDSVVFLHDGAYLYCDSSYHNQKTNTFEAFSNVRMEQGDTLFLYGNYMHYNGNTKLVRVRENVKMDHRNGTLFTDSLNYDRLKNIGYYFDGGLLVDSLNELTSYWGQYQPSLSLATFTDSVELNNPNFKLYSDTLLYSTQTRVATIVSPTRIESDSGTIYSSRGWYNTIDEKSLLLDQSLIVNKEGDRTLRGDSIIFFRNENKGEVFGNMFMQDTTKRVILTGHYGFYNGQTDYAFATDSASAIEYSQGDTLYLHGDTLELIKLQPERVQIIKTHVDTVKIRKTDTELEEPITVDSLIFRADTISEMREFHKIKAYYGVRFYRSDMQGVCDSLQFHSRDSILHMYKDPILWNLDRQLTGDTIDMYMNDSTIDKMYIKGFAFSIEQKDSIHFNQLKSRLLQFYFLKGQLSRVYAEGNVETIVYPEENDGTLNQILNWLQSSYLEIKLEDGVFNRLKAWPSPVGKTTPFHLIQNEQLRLPQFYWFDYLRPLDKDDIFRKTKRKEEDKRPKRDAIFDREEE